MDDDVLYSFPTIFIKKAPWLTAIILAVIALIIGGTNPLDLGSNWLHRLHSVAFSIGIVMAWLLAIKPNEKINWLNQLKILEIIQIYLDI